MTLRWTLMVFLGLGALLSACNTPVYCTLEPWLATFEVSAEQVEASGNLTLTLSVPATHVRCGPGYYISGARFYADGTLLGEGDVAERHPNNDPARYRYTWNVEPGEDGVSASGDAEVALSASLVTDQGVLDETEGFVTEQVLVTVGEGAPIQMDQESYTLELDGKDARFEPTASYVNRTDAPVYVEVCGTWQPFFGLEKLVGGRWEAVALAVGYGCTSELISNEVPPGGRFVQRFAPIFLDASEVLGGLYRMVWVGVQAEPSEDAGILPKPQRVSNAFELRDLR